jgi:hypothetical protein
VDNAWEKSESRVGHRSGEVPGDFRDGWSNEARFRGMNNCVSGFGGDVCVRGLVLVYLKGMEVGRVGAGKCYKVVNGLKRQVQWKFGC